MNCIGRNRKDCSAEITKSDYEYFKKLEHDECNELVMMQLNNKGEISFTIDRVSTTLFEIDYFVDFDKILDTEHFKKSLDGVIDEYRKVHIEKNEDVEEVKKVRSELFIKNIPFDQLV